VPSGDLAVFGPELLAHLPRASKTQYAALLDRDGVVVHVNRAWRHSALAIGGSVTAGVGTNYLMACERGAARGAPMAGDAVRLIRAALNGEDGTARQSFPANDAGEDGLLWFSIRAIPLPGRHRGVIVVYLDVTGESQESGQREH
jgi:hypothetical protein